MPRPPTTCHIHDETKESESTCVGDSVWANTKLVTLISKIQVEPYFAEPKKKKKKEK